MNFFYFFLKKRVRNVVEFGWRPSLIFDGTSKSPSELKAKHEWDKFDNKGREKKLDPSIASLMKLVLITFIGLQYAKHVKKAWDIFFFCYSWEQFCCEVFENINVKCQVWGY